MHSLNGSYLTAGFKNILKKRYRLYLIVIWFGKLRNIILRIKKIYNKNF